MTLRNATNLGNHQDEEALLGNIALLHGLIIGENFAAVDNLLLLYGMSFLCGDLRLEGGNLWSKASMSTLACRQRWKQRETSVTTHGIVRFSFEAEVASLERFDGQFHV